MTKQNIITAVVTGLIISTLGIRAVYSQPVVVPYTIEVVNEVQIKLTWITAPETTYLNVIHFPDQAVPYVGNAPSGSSMTITLTGKSGDAIQVQEYKLVGAQLQLVRFFNTAPIPDFIGATMTPTFTPTEEQSTTPVLSATPSATPTIDQENFKSRVWLPLAQA